MQPVDCVLHEEISVDDRLVVQDDSKRESSADLQQ